jgi:hypothetical protein
MTAVQNSKISYSYLHNEIKTIVFEPNELCKKLAALRARILEELNLEEITLLEEQAKANTGTHFITQFAVATCMIERMLKEVKNEKPQLPLLKKAQDRFEEGQLEEASQILKHVSASWFEFDKNELMKKIIKQYRLNGETAKADALQGKMDHPFLAENQDKNELSDKHPTNLQASEHTSDPVEPGPRQHLALEEKSVSQLKNMLTLAEREKNIQSKQYELASKTNNLKIMASALRLKEMASRDIETINYVLENRKVDVEESADDISF